MPGNLPPGCTPFDTGNFGTDYFTEDRYSGLQSYGPNRADSLLSTTQSNYSGDPASGSEVEGLDYIHNIVGKIREHIESKGYPQYSKDELGLLRIIDNHIDVRRHILIAKNRKSQENPPKLMKWDFPS